MRILAIRKAFFTALTICFSFFNTSAQDGKITVKQDTKFEQLLNEKRKTNLSNAVDEGYKIQIFSGESEKAKNTLNEFRQDFNSSFHKIVMYQIILFNE